MPDITPGQIAALGLIVPWAVFWLLYFDMKDAVRPEPRWALVGAFLLGVLSAGIAYAGYEAAHALGLPEQVGSDPLVAALVFFGAVGPLEEGAKFLVARSVVFRWKCFDERVDGIVYGAVVGLGFASVENLLFVPDLPTVEQLARTAATPLTHSLYGCVWGVGAALAIVGKYPPLRRFLVQTGTLVLAMFLHGLYDYAVVVHQATFVAAGVVLCLWIYVIWHSRRLVRRQRARIAAAAADDDADVRSDPPGPRPG